MKAFNQMTEAQQAMAVASEASAFLTAIIEGGLSFNDKLNGDDLQARIDAAAERADKMQTPWFVGEYILDTCRADIESMAMASAENALYPEHGEHCIAGIA